MEKEAQTDILMDYFDNLHKNESKASSKNGSDSQRQGGISVGGGGKISSKPPKNPSTQNQS